ncbi:MAG: PRC-barrel domain containing protein [Acidimicrobiales bacterium]
MRTTTELWNFGQDVRVQPADLVGYDVEATDGHIGKIDKASEDTSRRYLVVDTGFWIFGKKRMVPAGLVSRIDHDDKRVFISMSKDQVKSAPDYDDLERRYTDEDYDSTFGGYYRGLP